VGRCVHREACDREIDEERVADQVVVAYDEPALGPVVASVTELRLV
jgi:hypothetical protein